MLLTIREFKERVADDINRLVTDLQSVTGRLGDEEADSWRNSLPAASELLSTKALDDFHVYFGGSGHATIEYKMPAASSWCDLILLGSRHGTPSAIVLELKHWDTSGHLPGASEGLMMCGGSTRLHPSRQVGNYANYLRRFHSEVLDRHALVAGCVFFSKSGNADSYRQQPNNLLSSTFPIFTASVEDIECRFPSFVTKLLTDADQSFAQAFEAGRYKQDRGFVKQIGEQLLSAETSPFILLDRQDQAFLECQERVRRVVDKSDGANRKFVTVVHGPPGSGKSVIAARLWASLVTDTTTRDGNIVITTTSSSQNSNWVYLVEKAARLAGSSGIVKKATSYSPASLPTLKIIQKKFESEVFKDASHWRDNVSLLRSIKPFQPGSEDNAHLVTLVDEAHALINPEHPAGRSGPLGFAVNLGPQAYHIIRSSSLSIFFMDGDQGFRDRENTTVENIRMWAAELGASFDEIDLSGLQFRCAGSKEYTDWIQTIRSSTHPQIAARHASRWRSTASKQRLNRTPRVAEHHPTAWRVQGDMQFDVVDCVTKMELALREKIEAGYSARILSSFSRKWRTKDAESPHSLPPELMDFQIGYVDAKGTPRVWSRPWNVVVKGDYTPFIQAVPGSKISQDPLCEVGCPIAVRGFDFDYVGIIWAKDLVWRTNSWVVLSEHVEETGIKRTLMRAKKESTSGGPNQAELVRRVWQSYRILLTRALHGVVVYVEDDETRSYLSTAAYCG